MSLSAPGAPEAEMSLGFGASLLQMTLALVAVCALAALVLYLLRRRLPGATGPLRVRARLPLDARHTLYVVEAAGKNLLVGASDGGLHTLAELDAGKLDEALAPAAEAPGRDSILALARRAIGSRGSDT